MQYQQLMLRGLVGAVTAAVVIATLACGGAGASNSPVAPTATTPTTTGGGGTTASAATITITAAGVSPTSVTIAIGQTVTFVNNDTRAHVISSDPHPTHTGCPPVNSVDFLSPGQSRQTGAFTVARTCGFHDHNDPDNQAMMGSIRVQ